MSKADDAALIQALAEGREEVFAALYDRYAPALFRVAWTLLRSRPDAEDAVQEVFLGLVRARVLLTQVVNLRAYLFSALRHAAARLAARRPAGAPLPPDELPARTTQADEGVDPHLLRRLAAALAVLPPDQREVLTLKIDGGLTFAEVAAVLGIRPNTAASRYRYALEKLRALLKEDVYESRPVPSRPSRPGAVADPPSLP
jgi:RNA polymerase sigma-70 factor (ECF subfamily)